MPLFAVNQTADAEMQLSYQTDACMDGVADVVERLDNAAAHPIAIRTLPHTQPRSQTRFTVGTVQRIIIGMCHLSSLKPPPLVHDPRAAW
jgi:hypothetical protein